MLGEQGVSVSIKTGFADLDSLQDSICLSLLEVENPVLDKLSEQDFYGLRRLMVSCPRLTWFTLGDDLSFGIVDGLSRCVNVEVAGARFQVLHLSGTGAKQGPGLVMRLLNSANGQQDNEFREHKDMLQIPRSYTIPYENQHIHSHLVDSTRSAKLDAKDSAAFRLTIGKSGMLDGLHFCCEDFPSALKEHELELQVKATGVNSRDIKAFRGIVPETSLGLEASGIVINAGKSAAKAFQQGDRVATVSTRGAHATRVRCDGRLTVKLQDSMSFEEAASVPVVHTMAYYALVKLAKLSQG